MANAYIFFGKAGSGKGTQAGELKKYLESLGKKVIYIETGNFFRTLTSSNSFAGKRTKETIDQGGLMPVFFPIYAWGEALVKNFTGDEEIILDGVARRIDEGHALDGALDFFQITSRYVFSVDISDATALERLTIRGQGRSDDASHENIQKRLDWYQENVVPVVDYFKGNQNYIFKKIDGEVAISDVFEQIKSTLR